jgi:prepilin-type N-terminal cleavage/methylation domain-containing protein
MGIMKRPPRAFSLIEMMLVVAILAVLAALAVPAMSPQVDTARLEGSAEAVGSFLARAQAEAMASKRCVRVRLDANFVIADRLNVFDCDVSPATAPQIVDGAGLWVEIARLRTDPSLIALAFDPVPSETTASALGGGEPDQLRFRPSGRLWSADTDVTDDDGVIRLTHTGMSVFGPARTKKILVEAQGLVCVLDRGVDPTGTGNNLGCP